jgi:hypothetical protein
VKPGVALAVLSITTATVAQLRFLPGEAKEVSASYADGGVRGIGYDVHDPSVRFTSPLPI